MISFQKKLEILRNIKFSIFYLITKNLKQYFDILIFVSKFFLNNNFQNERVKKVNEKTVNK